MASISEDIAEQWAGRGMYFLVMGVGAFFAYFNERHGWVRAPEYPRLTDFLFDPIKVYLQAHLPGIAFSLGGLFIAASFYSFYRFLKADSSAGSAA